MRKRPEIESTERIEGMKATIHKPESSAKAWAWRIVLGPASVLDGVVEFFSLGFISFGAKLAVARNLARARAAAN